MILCRIQIKFYKGVTFVETVAEIVAEYVQELTGADVSDNGLAIKGSQAKNSKAKVEAWL